MSVPALVHRDRYELSQSTETRVYKVYVTERVIKEGVLRRIRRIRILVGVFVTVCQPVTELSNECIGTSKGCPTLKDLEHNVMTALIHTTKLHLPKAIDSITKWLWIPAVE